MNIYLQQCFFKNGNSEDGWEEVVESKLYYDNGKVFIVETQLKTDYHKDKELQENLFFFYIPEDLLITVQLSIIQKFMKFGSKTCYYVVLEVSVLQVLLSYNQSFYVKF